MVTFTENVQSSALQWLIMVIECID